MLNLNLRNDWLLELIFIFLATAESLGLNFDIAGTTGLVVFLRAEHVAHRRACIHKFVVAGKANVLLELIFLLESHLEKFLALIVVICAARYFSSHL